MVYVFHTFWEGHKHFEKIYHFSLTFFRQPVPPLGMDSTKASTGCRTSWKMLIAKKKFDKRFLCFDYYWIWNEGKNNNPKIIILLKIKIKRRIKKASSTTKDVYYYIPADQQKIACFFLLNKKFPFTFSLKQKQFSKIHFIIPPFSKNKKIRTKFFCHSQITMPVFLSLVFFSMHELYALEINLLKENLSVICLTQKWWIFFG